MTLDQLLTGTDAIGIRPVLRAAVPTDSLLDEPEYMERRRQSPRHSGFASRRDDISPAIASAACAALQRLNQPVVLLNRDRGVLFVNSAARRIETRRDCFLLRAHRLQLAEQRNHRALEDFLNLPPIAATQLIGPQYIRCRSKTGLHYFLFVEWLVAQPARGEPVAALYIYEPHATGRIGHDLLARIYGLTRMESQLVAALFVEPVLQAAAEQGGISLNTAKTHLKHVFVKCGVRSKAELLRMLALGPRLL